MCFIITLHLFNYLYLNFLYIYTNLIFYILRVLFNSDLYLQTCAPVCKYIKLISQNQAKVNDIIWHFLEVFLMFSWPNLDVIWFHLIFCLTISIEMYHNFFRNGINFTHTKPKQKYIKSKLTNTLPILNTNQVIILL